MKNFILDFKNKLTELEKYFLFLEFVDSAETHRRDELTIENKGQVNKKIIIDRDLQKILRSNSFLLLYNLVESSIRNAIIAIYDSVHDDSLNYEELSDKLQDVWLTYKSNQFSESKRNFKRWLKELISDVKQDNVVVFDKESIKISGNLDYDNINKIINAYGIYGRITGDKSIIKQSMDKVKSERNLLAHGNKTFCQSGEIITINELKKIRDVIIDYLNEVLLNTECYIDNKYYKK